MATKAERFRAAVERSGPKLEKKKLARNERRAPRGPEGERELAPSQPAPHNLRAGEKNAKTYEFEATGNGKRPSRKSTRGSEAHVKHGVEQQIRQLNRIHSPPARARRGGH